MIKPILKKILASNFILPFKKGQRFIFIYHDISNVDAPHYSPHYSTRPECFVAHINFLKKHFELCSLDSLLSSSLNPNKNYATIVFDDGFRSVKEQAAPILKASNIPFTIFLNKAAVEQKRLWLSDLELQHKSLIHFLQEHHFIDNQKEYWVESLKQHAQFQNQLASIMHMHQDVVRDIYLNATEVKALAAEGVTMGSHTVHHPVLALCTDEVQEQEIRANKDYLDQLLLQDTKHFALPFGKKEHFNTATLRLSKKVGHQYVYTSNPCAVSSQDIEQGLIPRIGLLNETVEEIMFYINRQFLKKVHI